MSDGEREQAENEKEVREETLRVQGQASWFANSPWWLISAGVHAVLLLGASLWALEHVVRLDNREPIVVVTGGGPHIIDFPETPIRDEWVHKGIPKDEPSTQPAVEPVIFFPEAKKSDHNESDDNEDFREIKGDSKDFLSSIKGEAGGLRGRQAGKTPGVYGNIGVGPGGGAAAGTEAASADMSTWSSMGGGAPRPSPS